MQDSSKATYFIKSPFINPVETQSPSYEFSLSHVHLTLIF